ncbi:helix-turn-helix domain-containing protein [Methylocystis rosea]|uniref:helix-turn-helix domain-containing protein n=1 Tax=Methylocystis rosea TaxID=173366 RepID=UPI000379F12D|nr:helix-turn-helix domain-containing protein [Methylocystis rosea]
MTPGQCRAARAFLQISQDELAKAANVGVSTVRDFEVGKRAPIAATQAAMRAALEAKGVCFVDREGDGALGIFYAEPQKGAATQE